MGNSEGEDQKRDQNDCHSGAQERKWSPWNLQDVGPVVRCWGILLTLHCHMSTGSMRSPPILATLRLNRFNELIPQITESIPNYNHRQSDSLRARLCNHCF